MRKTKPTRAEIHATVREVAEEVIDEMPFIRLGSLAPTRWGQLTDDELRALPVAQRLELAVEEIADIKASLTKPVRSRLGRS